MDTVDTPVIKTALLPSGLSLGAARDYSCDCPGDGCNGHQGGCPGDASCGQDCSCGGD